MKPQLYIPVSTLGLLVIGHCISSLIQEPVDVEWVALAVLALFTGVLTIKIPGVSARLSVSETFVFASILLFGVCAGTATIALEILIALAAQGSRQRTDPQRITFNVASGALSVWASGHAFYWAAGIPPLSVRPAPLDALLFPLLVLALTHFVLNSGLVSIAIALERRRSPLQIWKSVFAGLSINYFAGASLAALFVSYTRTIDLFALSVIIPLLLISYLTFKTSLGRIEDATRHVEQVKRLYISTIETLATAIDAKDQVTHGHIRRVQQLALGLAREVGLTDLQQLQALQAAALLHDTGKLVVPEHILNKPGKLTKGEFERMKQHASVGADILSSIDFPYPVVPIVRHHHENWDGTGYPDRLRGVEIPIGARILAVVDCFDALTSDRPYRPRMSHDDAVRIILERRGTMYDPLIVDAFVSSWRRLCGDVEQVEHSPVSSYRKWFSSMPPAHVDGALSDGHDLHVFLVTLIRECGAKMCVVFAIDREHDQLVPFAARVAEGPINIDCTLPLGSGVAGWVAVTGTSLLNADGSLDFRDPILGMRLVRSICVPIGKAPNILGVVAVYTDEPRGFTQDDQESALTLADRLASLPNARVFESKYKTQDSISVHTRSPVH